MAKVSSEAETAVAKVTSTADKAVTKVTSKAEEAVAKVTSTVDKAAAKVTSAADEAVAEVTSTTEEAVAKVTSTADEAVAKITSTADEAVAKVASMVDEAIAKATSTADEAVAKVISTVTLATTAGEAGGRGRVHDGRGRGQGRVHSGRASQSGRRESLTETSPADPPLIPVELRTRHLSSPTDPSATKTMGGKKTAETFHYHSYYKDSIKVQKRQNRVNDDEKHEEHPHLQDFLKVHHTAIVDPLGVAPHRKPALARPPKGILHKHDCPSRRPCQVTESKRQRRVAFKEVTVRDYAMVLGDHPNCSFGPPVTLGWRYLEYEPLEVDEYEYHHSRRRPLPLLMLNYYRRNDLLAADHTEAELKKAVKEKDRANLHRGITRALQKYWKVEAALESAGRKLTRAMTRERPEKQTYWEPNDELDWSIRGRSIHGRQNGAKSPIIKIQSPAAEKSLSGTEPTAAE